MIVIGSSGRAPWPQFAPTLSMDPYRWAYDTRAFAVDHGHAGHSAAPAGFRPQVPRVCLPCEGVLEEEPSGNNTVSPFCRLVAGTKLARAGSGSMLPPAYRLSSHCHEPASYAPSYPGRKAVEASCRGGPCDVWELERAKSREAIVGAVPYSTLGPAMVAA